APRLGSRRAERQPETVVFVRPSAYPAAAVHPDHRNLDSSRRSGLLIELLLVALVLHAQANAAPPPSEVERGRELYGNMCAVCHGPAGEGYRADQAPRIAHPDFLSTVNDAYLRRAIAQGRPGTTMSAWAKERGGPLPSADVDALVALLRSWSQAPPVRLDERPLSGDPARGKEIYAEECARCHGDQGREGPNIHIGSPQFLTGASNGLLRYAIRKGRGGPPHAGLRGLARQRRHRERGRVAPSLSASGRPGGAPACAPAPIAARAGSAESQGACTRRLQRVSEDDARRHHQVAARRT